MKELVIIGAGLGADTITLQGINEMKSADVILYDRLIHPDVLRFAECELVEVGKKPYDRHCILQSDINEMIVSYLNSGKRVVRLKGGDSTVFARAIEEIEAAESAGAQVRMIPGVTSAASLAAKMKTGLTDRRKASGVIFITGHPKNGHITETYDWEAMARLKLTIVIYMGVRNAPVIASELINHGMPADTSVIIGERMDTSEEKLHECVLSELGGLIEKERISNPSTIVIGEALSLQG